ncbi:hypothetical protein ONZ51_g4589 [Trametes cubensis]|uniref:Uncharacterized protein n=1 Tax=Trametes cubensis TaxID=1111947 RepID=A0AAD7XEH2_9APHY|nr:hypothetical protein ONZ51_g4589 [Trametes cubensis]
MPLYEPIPAIRPSLASTAQAQFPSLDSSIGALLIGTFISLILYGVNILQLFTYFSLHYRSESTPLRALILIFTLLETFHTIAPMHTCYYYMVTNYSHPTVLADSVWSLNILLALASITSFFAEGFFVRRVSLIGTKSGIVALVAALCLLTSNTSTVKAFQNEKFQSFGLYERDINAAALSLAAFANFLISGAIIVALYHAIACIRTVTSTDAPPLEGILTGILQMVATSMFLLHPESLYWSACGIVALKCEDITKIVRHDSFANIRFFPVRAVTLLSVLNSRKSMVDRGIMVFNNSNYERAAITRAQRIAVANQFNVPSGLSYETPPVINIKVAAEVEVHGQRDGDKPSPIVDVYSQAGPRL